MRRVIRSRETGKFFRDGEWAKDFREATNFLSTLTPSGPGLRHNVKNTELVLSFNDPRLYLAVSI